MRVVIYARVSTSEQELEQQISACRRFSDYRQFEVAEVITDIMSGAKAKRPGYLRLVEGLRRYDYDGVLVFRLDRLSRSSRELALLIDELEGKGIKVLSVNEQFDTSTAIGRAMRELIMIFAQLEREQIGEATSQRLQALKANGKKLGRKPASPGQVKRVLELHDAGHLPNAITNRSNLSYGTVYAIVHKQGVYAGSYS